jgi:hypothetical protein
MRGGENTVGRVAHVFVGHLGRQYALITDTDKLPWFG